MDLWTCKGDVSMGWDGCDATSWRGPWTVYQVEGEIPDIHHSLLLDCGYNVTSSLRLLPIWWTVCQLKPSCLKWLFSGCLITATRKKLRQSSLTLLLIFPLLEFHYYYYYYYCCCYYWGRVSLGSPGNTVWPPRPPKCRSVSFKSHLILVVQFLQVNRMEEI